MTGSTGTKSGLDSWSLVLSAPSDQTVTSFFSFSFSFRLFLFLSFSIEIFPSFPLKCPLCVKQDGLHLPIWWHQSSIQSHDPCPGKVFHKRLVSFVVPHSPGYSGALSSPLPKPAPVSQWEPSKNGSFVLTLVSWSLKWSGGLRRV